jgi:hypothetical protein
MFFGGAAIIAVAAVGGALALSGGGGGNAPASASATATATATQKPGASAVANNSPGASTSPSAADPGSPTPTLPPGVTPTTAPPNQGGGNNNPPNNGGGNNNPPNNGGGGGVVIPTPIPPTPVPPTATPVPPTPTPVPVPVVKLSFENFYIALGGDPQPAPNTDFDPPAGYQLYSSGSVYNSCNKRIVGVYAFSHSDAAAYTAPNRVVVDYSWTWEGSGQGGGTWTVRRDRTWYGFTNTGGLPNGTYLVTLTDEVSGITVSGKVTLSCQFG